MKVITVLLSLCFSVTLSVSLAEEKPNIVFILADDLGWADTTLYGHTKLYRTPNIERLAKRGMTFSRAYTASPLCSPTRSSILTGLSPARTGLTAPNCHLPHIELKAREGVSGPRNKKSIVPRPVTRLDRKYYTLGEALNDAGYVTGHFGKWHLGKEPYSPLEHGFDVDIPHWPGPGPAGSYVAPWRFPDFDPDTPSEHVEDRMAKEAVKFLEDHKEERFFLNYWMFSVHAPFDAKADLIEKYRKVIDPKSPQRSPTYAAMIESMDDAVGTLIDTLDRLGLSDNTIVVFYSDNGGNGYSVVDGTAPTSNAPLRGGKASMFEGGVRVPLIVSWPGVVAPGGRSDVQVQSVDFYPTILEMLELKPQGDQTFDGVSFVPALKGREYQRDPFFTYFPHDPPVPDWIPPSVSVHDGDWKLIRIFHGGEAGAHRWKLFNLRDDIGERDNLVDKDPTRVKQMDRLIESFLNQTGAVRPVPNPKFDPAQYNPELEGVGRIRAPARKSANKRSATTGAKRGVFGKPVAGWVPNHACRIQTSNGRLVVNSTGGDPYFTYKFPKALTGRPVALRITLASSVGGKGQVFWREEGSRTGFNRARSQMFDIQSGDAFREYRVEFSADSALTDFRLDPATAAGKIRISSMSLHDAEGRSVYSWNFSDH